jgi:Tol biopolymer transport system component
MNGRALVWHAPEKLMKEDLMTPKRIRTAVIGLVVAGQLLAATTTQAVYPGKDGRLAFGARVDGNADVYTMKENGNDLRRLTHAAGLDICASYSADGDDIAFCSNRTGFFEIWTMKANGSGERQVTHQDGFATFPDYSPDGGRIAFGGSIADGDSEI